MSSEQNDARNKNGKCVAAEVSEGDKEHVITYWRKGDLCQEVAEKLVELCSSVGWKVELVSEEHEDLAEGVSKQSVKDSAWFLSLLLVIKYERENKLRNELLSQKSQHMAYNGQSALETGSMVWLDKFLLE